MSRGHQPLSRQQELASELKGLGITADRMTANEIQETLGCDALGLGFVMIFETFQ